MKRRLLKLSIHTTTINKNLPPAEGWVNIEWTIQQLNEHVRHGHPFTCQLINGYRRTKNFQAMDVAAVDIDDGMSWEQALQHPFITKHAALLYTTPSHSDVAPRLRVVFILPDTVLDGRQMGAIYKSLSRILGGDLRATDPARLFYGSTGCKSKILSGFLSASDLDAILKENASQPSSKSEAHSEKLTGQKFHHLSANTLTVTTARGESALLANLPVKTSIYCPYHNDRNPSAFVVRSERGLAGIHCKTCNQTFWDSGNAAEFDFYKFDRQVRDLSRTNKVEEGSTLYRLAQVYNSTPKATIVNSRYLESLPAGDGLVLVKSPKGTGKTKLLSELVRQEKRRKRNVLVLSHRRLLISQLSKQLGLDSYLDHKSGEAKCPKHFIVCLDSLSNYLSKSKTRYHTIIIDECEQVFSHICGATIPDNQKKLVLLRILDLINTANKVLLLDADISELTVDALIGDVRQGRQKKRVKILLNTVKASNAEIEVYRFKGHLLEDFQEAVRQGKRCFVTSNSKKLIDKLYSNLRAALPDKRIHKLTGGDSAGEESKVFIENISDRILDLDVLLCTPVLGTGTDISFSGADRVDVVFGFFEANVNTHLDIDQQMSRVRNPGCIKIYISRQKSDAPVHYESVLKQLIEAEAVPDAIYAAGPGKILSDPDHPLLRLTAYVRTLRNASGNNLYGNFIAHKEAAGWCVTAIQSNESKRQAGNLYARNITKEYSEHEIGRILSAPSIDDFEYERLKKGRKLNKLTDDDRYKLTRADIEAAYQVDISRDLIMLDAGGRFRKSLDLYRKITDVLFHEARSRQLGGNVINFPLNRIGKNREPSFLLYDLFVAARVFQNYRFDSDVEYRARDLGEFVKACRKEKARIEEYLGCRIRSDLNSNPTRQLGDLLKLVGLKHKVSRTERLRGGGKDYVYKIDLPRLEILEKYSSSISLKRKRAALAA